jgi:CSLREA domain-containing protein
MVPGVVLRGCRVSFTRPRYVALLLIGLALAGAAGSASAATVVQKTNGDPITFPERASTWPYPTTITVTGIDANVITKMSVVLNDFTHGYPEDVDVLLVGPGGERAILMSDAGTGNVVTDIDLTFSPAASTPVPQGVTLTTGTFLPANYASDGDSFPGPAPTTHNLEPADLTVFNGTNPNGGWSLYVYDDYEEDDGGDIGGGWTLLLTVPTVFTVTKTADTNDGVCDGDCSLREAITAATAASGDDDLIRFSSLFNTPQTITLGGSELLVTESMTIQGPGADLLTISGNDASNVFGLVTSGSVTLKGFTVRDGFTPGDGAGIYSEAAFLNLRNVAVAGNRAGGDAAGVFMFDGVNQFIDCTFNDNLTAGSGAAFMQYSNDSASLKVVNSTISGNRAAGDAAVALFAAGAGTVSLDIINSTIAVNSGTNGGGIWAYAQGGPESLAAVSLRNSILAGNGALNLRATSFGDASSSITTLGFNLADEDTGGHLHLDSDLTGIDPRLGPLTNNGGQTESHALMGGSPALDAGEKSGYQKDQRNLSRTFDAPLVATAEEGDGSDIGALEMQALMVTSSDESSLRQALLDANANAPAHADILFDPEWFFAPRVILLQSVLPAILTSVNIVGPGSKLADVRRNDGGAYRIFEAHDAAGREFSISGLTISNGSFPGGGGGIFSHARTSLTEVLVFNNFSTAAGGGGAELSRGTIKDSTFALNSGFGLGGALYVRGTGTGPGSVRVINSTFFGNVGGQAPGIALVSEYGATVTLELINTTITSNSGSADGGLRVHTAGGGSSIATAILRNSIVAGNDLPNLNATTSGGGPSTIESRGYNLTNDASATYLDQATDKINSDPLLGGLLDNGGATTTVALLPNSPALDAGGRSGFLRDQRGFRRPIDQSVITNSANGDGSDIGAVEMVPEIIMKDGFE